MLVSRVDDRSKRIVETAIELAARDGFAAVRLRDVAAQAKVALGTVYKRFASKEEILVVAMQREGERMLAQMTVAPPGEVPLERAVWFFDLATRGFCRRPKLAKAMLRAIASGEGMSTRVASLHALVTIMLVAALDGHPPTQHRRWGGDADSETREVARILLDVWFASLVGWAGGATDIPGVVKNVERAASRLL